ncbi:unnamed protein product, partial [Medioppia subpectinata]
ALEAQISGIERQYKVPPQTISEELKYDLVEAVYEWANGKSFAEVLDITPVQEGIIVRCIQRLDELLKYIKMAANKMGNKELEEKAREKMLIKEFLRLFVGLKALLLFLKP